MNAPRTTREALIAEMLGDMGTLLDRLETLPPLVTSAEESIAATVTTLDAAGQKYRVAVTAFTDQAKMELTDYLDRKTGEATARLFDEQRQAAHDAVCRAALAELTDTVALLARTMGNAAHVHRAARWSQLVEHALTALLASAFTAGILYLMGK